MKFIIRGIKAFFMVIGAGCFGLFLLAWSDIHWMLTSPDNAVPPWELERLEAEADLATEPSESDILTAPKAITGAQGGAPSLDEAGPTGVTR